MTQQVRVHPLIQTGPQADCPYHALDRPRFQRLVGRFAGHKQAVAALALDHVLLHHQPRTNREVHHTVLIALAGDAHRTADEVKIGHVKLCDLTQSAATRHEKFNQRLFAVSYAGITQPFQFFHRQRLACSYLVDLDGLDLAHRVLLDFLFHREPAEKRPQAVDMRLQ